MTRPVAIVPIKEAQFKPHFSISISNIYQLHQSNRLLNNPLLSLHSDMKFAILTTLVLAAIASGHGLDSVSINYEQLLFDHKFTSHFQREPAGAQAVDNSDAYFRNYVSVQLCSLPHSELIPQLGRSTP